MNRLLQTFREGLREMLLDLVWRQWCQMGVSGVVNRRDNWVIDPEALLAFTTQAGRHDARLFDATLDWLVRNGQWINVQRLGSLIEKDKTGCGPVAGAIAAWMMRHDKSAKWHGLAARMLPAMPVTPVALFHSQSVESFRSGAEIDPDFSRYGLLRAPVVCRGASQDVDMVQGVNVLFRFRALFGIGIRADVIASILISPGGHARGIAEALAYNPLRVQRVLAGLAEAGFATVHRKGRTKKYEMETERWWKVLMGNEHTPASWIDWRALTRALTRIWRTASAMDAERADDDIVQSELRAALREAHDDLHRTGLQFHLQEAPDQGAQEFVLSLLSMLSMPLKGLP
ncbi:hypothetical protein GX586_01055 [bacterium]|nr:hypothetical protein [bacterium]